MALFLALIKINNNYIFVLFCVNMLHLKQTICEINFIDLKLFAVGCCCVSTQLKICFATLVFSP